MTALLALAGVAQSIVLIAASIEGGAKTGTGFAISSTSTSTQFLTAAHVVEGSTAAQVFVGGPRGKRYTATIVRIDRLRDVALLQIPEGNFATLTLGDMAPPLSGTDVEVVGYPTIAGSAASGSPSASPSPLPLGALEMKTFGGKADGVAEQGESILVDVPVTHGDSGAPIIETKSNRVVGLVLGLAGGYGVAHWMSGDGLGLSVAAVNAFLGQLIPAVSPVRPTFPVAIKPNANAVIAASLPQLAGSAGFVIANFGKPDPCRGSADGPTTANGVIEEDGDATDLSIFVTDCSGAPFYRDGMTVEHGGVHDLVRLIGRTFLGYVDTHPAEWKSLLKFGVAVDPQKNPYLALMSVQRNPFGQLMVAHVFRGGPADVAGLHPDDAILKIDGRPTRALADPFIARLLNQPSVTLLLDRNEREFSVRLRLRRFAEVTASGPIPH